MEMAVRELLRSVEEAHSRYQSFADRSVADCEKRMATVDGAREWSLRVGIATWFARPNRLRCELDVAFPGMPPARFVVVAGDHGEWFTSPVGPARVERLPPGSVLAALRGLEPGPAYLLPWLLFGRKIEFDDRLPHRVERRVLEGRDCHVARFETGTDCHRCLWIDADNRLLLRAEAEGRIDWDPSSTDLDMSALSPELRSAVWSVPSGTITSVTQITYRSAVNAPVPASLFNAPE